MQQPKEDRQFIVRQSGNIGKEIVAPNGKVVAWTVDRIIARIVVNRLNEFLGVPPILDGDETDA